MDFNLTDEQKLLLDTVRSFVARDYSFETRRARVKEKTVLDPKIWRAFADLGWLGVGIPEELGGYGGSSVETMLIAEMLGKGQVLEPYSLCGVFPGCILSTAAIQGKGAGLLTQLIAGETLVAVAHSESQARGNVADIRTTAGRTGTGWTIRGRKSLVVGGECADRLIVSARSEGGHSDEAGISLFVVALAAKGIQISGNRLVDWTSGVDVEFDAVEVNDDALLTEPGGAYPILQDAVDKTIIALCAEAVGAIEGAIEITADYIKTRHQFGVALSTFQALQHRMSDMAIELVQARSAVYRALQTTSLDSARDRSVQISGCKALVTRTGKWATSQGIQLHGGYGITEEYCVGQYYKRLLVIDALFGRQDHHLNRYARWMIEKTRGQSA